MPNEKISIKWLLGNIFEIFKIKASIEIGLLRAGVAILALGAGGAFFKFVIPTEYGDLALSLFTESETSYLLIGLGFAVTVLSSVMIWRKRQAEIDAADHKRVLAVEFRGLQDTSDTPLETHLPDDVVGTRHTTLIDIRKFVQDGIVRDPAGALGDVSLISRDINQWKNNQNRKETSIYVGGLMPVPFTFLAGMLVDDEHRIDGIYDWDRDQLTWRPLNDEDDGCRFIVEGLDTITADVDEVVVAISASYDVDHRSIRSFKAKTPIVRLDLVGRNTSCHWSEHKQIQLVAQFRDVMVALSGKGVRTVHLFLAGASSLVFRLGTAYDKRNMPPAVIYQYERSMSPPYPWGVSLPTHGVKAPTIINT